MPLYNDIVGPLTLANLHGMNGEFLIIALLVYTAILLDEVDLKNSLTGYTFWIGLGAHHQIREVFLKLILSCPDLARQFGT